MNFDSISVSATRGAIQTVATRLEESAADVYSCTIGAPSSTRDAARGDADRDRKVSWASDASLSQKEQRWFVVVLESLGKENKCLVSENFTAFVFSFLSTSQQHSCARDGLGPDCCVARTQACASSSRSSVLTERERVSYSDTLQYHPGQNDRQPQFCRWITSADSQFLLGCAIFLSGSNYCFALIFFQDKTHRLTRKRWCTTDGS